MCCGVERKDHSKAHRIRPALCTGHAIIAPCSSTQPPADMGWYNVGCRELHVPCFLLSRLILYYTATPALTPQELLDQTHNVQVVQAAIVVGVQPIKRLTHHLHGFASADGSGRTAGLP